MMEKVICPGTFTDMPSAIVLAPPTLVMAPFFQDSYIEGNDLD